MLLEAYLSDYKGSHDGEKTPPTEPLVLPDFLTVDREVTLDPNYSMWNLSLVA